MLKDLDYKYLISSVISMLLITIILDIYSSIIVISIYLFGKYIMDPYLGKQLNLNNLLSSLIGIAITYLVLFGIFGIN